jgi:hypothetical protein
MDKAIFKVSHILCKYGRFVFIFIALSLTGDTPRTEAIDCKTQNVQASVGDILAVDKTPKQSCT